MKQIPVCEPVIGVKEIEYVLDTLKTGWVSSQGKYITEFEKKFARYCGCRYGISTTSGTTALHLALAAAGVGPRDEVIIPTFTMIATAYAVVYTGATPVLVDAEPETWNMDVTRLEEKITPRTRVIMPVHIYGHPCDMDAILAIAARHNLPVIDDAAEAHGVEYRGRKIGSLGNASCFSFYANKIITTGEGGMLVTNDEKIATKARELKDLAHGPGRRYLHNDIAFNYRMTNVQAAIGLAQLENIEQYVASRRRHGHLYNSLLRDIPGITTPPEKEWAKNVYWMYSILVGDRFGLGRDELMANLREAGIDTRTFFIPMHLQPALKDRGLFHGESYPVAEDLSRRGLYLPSGSGLSEEDIAYVCRKIKEIRQGKGNR